MGSLLQRLGPNASRVVAAAALLLAVIVVLMIVSGSGGTYTMKAQFDDVRGLIPGGAVRAGAIPVGAVESVELEGTLPVVTMKIDKDFPLYRGAKADIQLFSNAGAVNRTVELTSGDSSKGRLPEGSLMKGPQTDQPVNFDDASETLNAPTRKDIKRFLIGLDTALKGRGKDFDRTLRHSSEAVNEAGNLLAQVNSDGAALKTLVRQGSRVTTALASSPADLGSAADRTASLLAVTARRQAELGRSVQLLGPSLARGREALAALAAATPRLRTLVKGLGPVADELGPFAKALPPTLRNADPFLGETRILVKKAPGYLKDLEPIIVAARGVTGGTGDRDIGKLVTEALPLANSLRAYIPETVGLFQNLGAAVSSYDANGHMVNLKGGLFQSPPSSLATEIGPDACTAGRLKAPYIRTPGALVCQPWTDYAASSLTPGRR
jgi:phospholipid/cholesterol/gamma-HCH transport system substrate-binding protein